MRWRRRFLPSGNLLSKSIHSRLRSTLREVTDSGSFDNEYKEAAKWSTDYSDKPWHVFNASTPVSDRQPHLILRVMFNCPGDNNLTRSELIVLLNFLHLAVKRQISVHESKLEKNEGSKLRVKVPVGFLHPLPISVRLNANLKTDPYAINPKPSQSPNPPVLLRRNA